MPNDPRPDDRADRGDAPSHDGRHGEETGTWRHSMATLWVTAGVFFGLIVVVAVLMELKEVNGWLATGVMAAALLVAWLVALFFLDPMSAHRH